MDEGKPCNKCQVWKPLSAFGRDAKSKHDGLRGICKDCERRLYTEPRAEQRRARAAAWNKAHRDRCNYNTRKTMARRHGYEGEIYSDTEWLALKAHYGARCLCCGRAEPDVVIVADHVVPAVKGGAHSIDNIQPLCTDCNYRKKDRHIDYRLTPFRPQATEAPIEQPRLF